MNKEDKKNPLNRFVIGIVLSIAISAISAHLCIPWLAIILGFGVSMGILQGAMGFHGFKELGIDTLICLAGSQMGWVALLI